MILLEALTFFMKSLNINPRDSDKDHIVIPKHLHTHHICKYTHAWKTEILVKDINSILNYSWLRKAEEK